VRDGWVFYFYLFTAISCLLCMLCCCGLDVDIIPCAIEGSQNGYAFMPALHVCLLTHSLTHVLPGVCRLLA
jgi:hypothetical protein